MVTFEFPPMTSRVKVKFDCPTCGAKVESDWLEVPQANYGEDTREKSLRTKEYDVVCPECNEQFSVTVGESVCGGEGWIDELPEDTIVEVEWEQDPED